MALLLVHHVYNNFTFNLTLFLVFFRPMMINKTFPADHPYTSHIPRTALFPTFDSDMDPKRGVAARSEQPISNEMPANAFGVEIIHKTKG